MGVQEPQLIPEVVSGILSHFPPPVFSDTKARGDAFGS